MSEIEQKIKDVQLAEELSKRYLSYAMSTIVSRSLPDVRDGLKPVHRRLMYAMRQLHLDPKAGFKKCARVVGDVIGKYHPHGDSAVYGAMARLAQDFSVRYPLVDGQGNFGNIDGDGPAAMRYTEARLTDFAMALMEGLNDNAVDFMDTYDGEENEPLVMPAAVPNLLCNGTSGIAVGMATNIPPHNLSEVCDALLYLIENPQCEIEPLVKRIKGPDFPTGGVIVDKFVNDGARIKNINKLRFMTGYVYKNPFDMFFNKTVREEIEFGMKYFKYKLEKIDMRASDALKLVGLDDSYLDLNPLNLTLVDAKKVALACALVYNPKILILDEYTCGISNNDKIELLRLLRILKTKYKKTIILLSKDTSFCYQISDKIYLLHLTRLVKEGDKYILKDTELLKSINLEIPPIISFTEEARSKGHDLYDYTNILDLIKGVYRDVF